VSAAPLLSGITVDMPFNPMSDEELQRKFAGQAVPVLGDAAADQLATAIWRFGNAEHITELFGVAATAEES
jgi:hypothetical protein